MNGSDLCIVATESHGWNGHGGSFFEQALTKPDGDLEGGNDLKAVARRLYELKTDPVYGEKPDAFAQRIMPAYDIRPNNDDLGGIPSLTPADRQIVQAELVRLGLPQHQQQQLAAARAEIDSRRMVEASARPKAPSFA